MFVSQVDPTKPQQGNALTADLRNNLATIKSELEVIGNNRIKVNFSFGDATPKVIFQNTILKTIVEASIVVLTPFNGVGASLSLGDLVDSSKFIASVQNDPSFACEWHANPNTTTNTDIILTINPGSAATQGSGFIILEII